MAVYLPKGDQQYTIISIFDHSLKYQPVHGWLKSLNEITKWLIYTNNLQFYTFLQQFVPFLKDFVLRWTFFQIGIYFSFKFTVKQNVPCSIWTLIVTTCKIFSSNHPIGLTIYEYKKPIYIRNRTTKKSIWIRIPSHQIRIFIKT